ncbi:conserved hypothetical protein [Candida dubliniensis CD36]|uniref:Uncharacterized protein n=1 Tax=Candida dubliniensis (strain CD36 / ATCC MYA-646 / CBS 7987 / NCPF 3949 / NRRL Y-17841) TaxID=573826 RepID=B9W967_CANDC|nr:conserved hypothetical protein [Candida dubliniensis CD36]CAX45325.1 conserved hypothetical protein [Candida dubliniensis CD36]
MIDTEAFVRNSPFKLTHSDSSDRYNLNNTTPDLLKFQLQEQYRSTMSELHKDTLDATKDHLDENNTNMNFSNGQALQDSFSNHLQSQLDSDAIHLSTSTGNLSIYSTTTSTYVEDETEQEQNQNKMGENDENNLDSFISSQLNKPNYLNLKILIENSIFDTNKITQNSILPLTEVRILKSAIDEKQDLQQYLLSKIAISQSFFNDVVSQDQEIEKELLIKIMKTQSSLQTKLISTTTELESLKEKLANHNISCLVLGYIEDVKASKNLSANTTLNQSPINSPGKIPNNRDSISPNKYHFSNRNSQTENMQHLDSLFAHIASVAAQRNIPLPSPPATDGFDAKIAWVQQCIDSILSEENIEVNAKQTKEISRSASKSSKEYKTALNDLRFSYEYLSKEYEHSRDASNKLIHDYRKKISQLERDLKTRSTNTDELMSPPPTTTGSFGSTKSGTSISYDLIESKDKEICRLRKELNLLKIDKLGKPYGNNHNNNSTSSFLQSPNLDSHHQQNAYTSVSPITGEFLNIPELSSPNEEEEENATINSHSSNNGNKRPVSISGFSNGILRKEFKKIVSDIQDQYEMELAEERLRRRKLQEQLDQSGKS